MYLGIDVSKLTIDCCLIADGQNHQKKFQNNKVGFEQLTKWLQSHKVSDKLHCVCEATGTYYEALAEYLYLRYTITVENPRKIKGYAIAELQRSKTDTQDAKLIAQLPRPKAQIKSMATAGKRTEAITGNRPIFRLSETATRNRKSQTPRSTRLYQIPYSNNYFKSDSTNTDSQKAITPVLQRQSKL